MKYNTAILNVAAGLIVAGSTLVGQGAHAQRRLSPPSELLVEPIPNPAVDGVAGVADLPGMVASPDDLPPGDLVPGIPDPTLESHPYRDAGGNDDGVAAYVPGQTERYLECQPALLESTGTWLRRGFWYAEIDAVIMTRNWNADSVVLASEQTGTTAAPGGFPSNVPVANQLIIDETDPGAEGLPRLTLGKFLFRDAENRDHVAELTWYGGGQWTQRNDLQALAGGNGLQVPVNVDGGANANPSFDGATSSNYRYDSHLDSVELNYMVRQRMSKDQMVLKPDGRWIRRATPTRTLGLLAGVRYVNNREAFAWDAQGIPDSGNANDPLNDGTLETGRYFVTTDNNLIGTQFGASIARETARWSLGLEGKIGGFWNGIDMNSSLNISESAAAGDRSRAQSNASDDTLSVIAEASLVGKWHLTPRWSIRTGLEVLWIESIALAPHQLNFIPGGYDVAVDTGGAVYLGTSLGVESYW